MGLDDWAVERGHGSREEESVAVEGFGRGGREEEGWLVEGVRVGMEWMMGDGCGIAKHESKIWNVVNTSHT